MPELPEVNTLVLALEKHLIGDSICEWQSYSPRLRRPVPACSVAEEIINQPIISIKRIAKSIYFDFGRSVYLHVHLGMTGSFLLQSTEAAKEKHEHLRIVLKSGKILSYIDPRRFGVIELVCLPEKNVCEPTERSLTSSFLKKQCSGSEKSIKSLIMDQSVIAGIGNIYASESLLEAGILPFREAGSLSDAEHKKLAASIVKVIKRAVRAGAESLKPEYRIDSQTTHFEIDVKAYGREGQLCGKCHQGLIMNARIAGRSSFFCPICQI